MNTESKARRYSFGNFTLDLEKRVLLRDGEPVPLTPKAFDTLALLVRRSGHVVGKDELLEEIWADAFVEESTIAQNVFTLRKALGQNQTENQFIETVPKHGYRFIADVEAIDGATNGKPEIGRQRAAHDLTVGENISDAGISDAETSDAEIGNAETVNVTSDAAANLPTSERRDLHSANRHTRFNFRTKLLAPLMLLLAVAIAVGLFLFTQRDEAASDFAAPSPRTRTTQLTNTGQVLRAAVSPDGKYVAYIQSERGQESLWLRQVDVASGIELVPPSGSHFVGITFSPDSNSVFYVKYGQDAAGSGLYQVPVLGGAARKLVTDIDSQISFAPDKRHFTFVRNDLRRKEALLIIANLDDARSTASRSSARALTGRPTPRPPGRLTVRSLSLQRECKPQNRASTLALWSKCGWRTASRKS